MFKYYDAIYYITSIPAVAQTYKHDVVCVCNLLRYANRPNIIMNTCTIS